MAYPLDPDCPFCEKVRLQNCAFKGPDVAIFEPLNPVVDGHLLVIPTRHIANASLSPGLAGECMKVAALEVSMMQQDANIITSIGPHATQTIQHMHLHIVPRSEDDGLMLPWTNQVKE